MRNRLIVILLSAVSAVSCLKGGGYESSCQLVATFDGFSEAWDKNYYNGEFYGDDKAFFEGAITENNLVIFNCLYEKDMNDFSGFGLSLVTVKDEGYDARFSVNAETAYSGEVFALFHNNPEIKATSSGLQSDYHVFFATTQGTCTPVSCMVNNTKLVADGIAAYNAAHETPIEVTLTATGYLNGVETGSADILLAGPEGSIDKDEESDESTGSAEKSGSADEDGAEKETPEEETPASSGDIMSEWTRFDLSELGNIEYITFSLSFSDKSQTEIPEYFCMDNFAANVHILIPAE